MNQRLAHIAVVVNDYDEAIKFYTEKLHFVLEEDTYLSETKRWVLVKPNGSGGTCLLLAKATTEEQKSRIGNQAGGRVFLFLHTDNFERDYQNLLEHKIEIVRPPQWEPYGTVAVFKDIYGNLWDLIEKSKQVMRPKELVNQWVDIFNQADPVRLSEFYADDAINHQVANEPVIGKEAIKKMFIEEFSRAKMVCIIENVFEDGEWAMLEWRDPNGLRGCGFFHVQGGKIIFQRGYWDKLSLLRLQGLPVPQE